MTMTTPIDETSAVLRRIAGELDRVRQAFGPGGLADVTLYTDDEAHTIERAAWLLRSGGTRLRHAAAQHTPPSPPQPPEPYAGLTICRYPVGDGPTGPILCILPPDHDGDHSPDEVALARLRRP